jgi:hypothetical protein
MRTYGALEFCPPPTRPSSDAYNIFNGFAAEGLDADASLGDAQPFLDHARVIAGNDDKCFTYLIDYFADIIQYPGRLSNMAIVLRGKQGVGKNLLTDFLIEMVLGTDIGFDCDDPANEMFGKFSNSRLHKVLIAINEAKGQDFFPNAHRLKAMITSGTFTYEEKGINPVKMANFARLIFTTNNDNPVKIEDGDRRFVVFDCGDKYKGDFEYFDKMRDYVRDPSTAKAVFEYLKSVDLSDVNLARDRPITEAYNEIRKAAISFECNFLKDLTELYIGKTLNFTASALYQKFLGWKTKNGMTLDINALAFGWKITKMSKETDQTHIKPVRTKKGNGYIVDMDGLRAFMIEKKYMDEDEEEVLDWRLDVLDVEDVKAKQASR